MSGFGFFWSAAVSDKKRFEGQRGQMEGRQYGWLHRNIGTTADRMADIMIWWVTASKQPKNSELLKLPAQPCHTMPISALSLPYQTSYIAGKWSWPLWEWLRDLNKLVSQLSECNNMCCLASYTPLTTARAESWEAVPAWKIMSVWGC